MAGLEEAVLANTVALKEHNEILKQMLAKAGGAAAAPGKADGKATKADGDLTVDSVKALVAPWLREFKANESDPENEARSDKFAAALKNLGVERIGDIKTQADLLRLKAWTAKQVAAGRITPAPEADLDAPGGGVDDI